MPLFAKKIIGDYLKSIYYPGNQNEDLAFLSNKGSANKNEEIKCYFQNLNI